MCTTLLRDYNIQSENNVINVLSLPVDEHSKFPFYKYVRETVLIFYFFRKI